MTIAPEELAQYRSESGLTQKEFANLLNDALGMSYSASTVSQWEGKSKKIPGYVQDAISDLMAGGSSPPNPSGASGEPVGVASDPSPSSADRRPDSPPGRPEGAPTVAPPTPGVGLAVSMESVCIEMFRGIGQMIETAGVFFSPAKVIQGPNGQMISLVEMDGRLIAGDAESLGRAWAKLAATNAWVARIITSMTTGGAWVEVIAATSGTVMKVYQNHAQYSNFLAAQNGHVAEPDTADTESVI